MKELSEQLEEVKNDTTVIGDNPPKTRALFDLVKQGNYTAEDVVEARKNRQMATAPNYQSRNWIKFKTGFENGLHEIGKTGNNLEIWGGQGALSIGGISGSQRVENFGRSLISSAYSEIEAKDKKYAQKAIPLSEDEYEDFPTALGAGLANYGGMLGLGYLTGGVGSVAGLSTKAAGALTETAGLGSMFAMELGGKAQDKINAYIEKSGDVDLKDYTADIASKDFMFSAMYASGSMIMEKKFGFGEQRKLFKMPFGQRLKNVAKIAVSEGGTELSQGLYEIGVDVAGGYLDFSKLPESFMQALQAGAVGGVLGGGAGIAAAIGHRSQAKAILREQLQNTVPEKDLDNVVDAIYEEADETARSVIAQELVQSEELRNKHGAIYEQIKDVINKQITDAGAFSDVEEAKKAQYIEGEASRFADEVLAEANKRGVTIDDVLTPNDIVYKDGRIYLQGLTEEQQKIRERKRRKKSREEVKPQEDELKAQIEENAPAEEKEQNLNDVVSSYEGAENYDVESMSTDEKQAVFEAEEAVKDSFTAPEETYDDTDNTSVDIAVKEGILAEQMEFLSTLSDYDKNRVLRTIIEKEHTEKDAEDVLNYAEELYNKTSYQGMSNLFWDIYLDPKASEKTKKKAKDIYDRIFNVTEQTENQEDVEEYDPTKEYNEYDVVKRAFNGQTKYTVLEEGKWLIFDSLEEAKRNAELYKNVKERNREYEEKVKAEKLQEENRRKNVLITGEGEVPMSYIIENLKSEGIWDSLGAKTKGNINAFEDYIVSFKDGEITGGRLYDGKAAKKRQTLVVNAQNAIKKLREKMQASQVTEETKEELSPETNEAIQENTLPEVEKEDTTTPDKIEDFGEKIEGARKDLWQNYKDKLNAPLPNDINNIKLSVIFPEPNYQKAIAAGVDVNALATIKALRDIITARPKYGVKSWLETVENLRGMAARIVNNDFDMSVVDDILNTPQMASLKNQIELYRMLGYPYFTKAKGYMIKTMYYHKYYAGEYAWTTKYEENVPVSYRLMYKFRDIRVNGDYKFDNVIDGVEEIKRRIDNESAKEKKIKFDIYSYINKPNEIILGKKVASGKYINLHTFSSAKEAREYLANNYESLVSELEALKKNPIDRGDVNRARLGEDYRNGTDVSPEVFSDTFGFRGVQFGNWVEQKTRIKDLNEAYDALVDLSKVLNIPTRAISLNGTLGLAFGARGHKGAAAHYEPDKVVINLTKMMGAGSLAHEWFHALDNSFMKKENKDLDYVSEKALANNPLFHNRPEVMIAFMNLRNVLEKSGLMERAKHIDMYKSKDYWSTIREMGARTFEQYVKDKLAEKGTQNDFLANIIETGDDFDVYLHQDEKADVYAAYDKLFNTLKTRETEKGVEFYQGDRIKRGSFDALTKSIKITDKADFSTYTHEFAHYWLDNMWNYANSEMASQNYKDQFNEVKKWLNVKADQTYLTSAQHEKFARGYEKYLYTGNIPNPIIGDVFKDYNEFIKEVYESLEEVDTRAGKKYEPITPVMKEFFDSMITGKIEEKPTEEAQEKPTTETKEVKPRGLAKTTAEMAEQKGIEVEKPTYEVRKQTKMAEKADEFIKENKQLAIDIVKGLAPEQDGIFREDLFAALRELALNEGDSDLLNDLSRSMTVEEATELGQRIQALARGRINPVKEMTELREERMKKNKVTKEKIKDETKKATKEIENEIALAAEPKEWQEFVKSLEC